MDYELFKEGNIYKAVFETDNNLFQDIMYYDGNPNKSEKSLIKYFYSLVNLTKISPLIAKEYIEPNFENILYSVRDISIGYHVSEDFNREGILIKGILPNGCKDELKLINKSQLLSLNG